MVVTFLLFYAHCSNKRKEREAFEKTLVIFVAIIRKKGSLVVWIPLCPTLMWVDACYLRLPIGGLRNLITGSLLDDIYNSIRDCCSYVLSRSMLLYL